MAHNTFFLCADSILYEGSKVTLNFNLKHYTGIYELGTRLKELMRDEAKNCGAILSASAPSLNISSFLVDLQKENKILLI